MIFYDVIVIGGGHAGCEAALAAARLGAKTLLITMNLDHLAQMSCNPAIGGIAKGQVVREIDALGGLMGRITDASSIQFRMLNRTKGPAVWSPRAQCDKVIYQKSMKWFCEQEANLDLLQSEVSHFFVENEKIIKIEVTYGIQFHASSFVLSSGTFLKGTLHYGLKNFPGGRAGDPPSNQLSNSLKDDLKLELGRLKTGTPPRILAKSIDFSQMQRQESDFEDEHFSFFEIPKTIPQPIHSQMPCYMVHSTEQTSQIIRDNLHLSPMYQGKIKGIGARYCPSFEDKVVRFPHHPTHLIFLEPEGETTGEYYTNGISTSLPPEVQYKLIRSIPGLEKASFTRFAYAIEYDFVYPHQIYRTLQTKKYSNFFLAGQINGTSGYEEAAGQGLIAGFNAARVAQKKEPIELGRDIAYIGVMIDDLVTKKIIEPYRLFTSRAEYRLHLRQDNANMRLCEFAYQNGLLKLSDYQIFTHYRDSLNSAENVAKSQKLENSKTTLWEFIKDWQGILPNNIPDFVQSIIPSDCDEKETKQILRQITINAHYECYLKRENSHIHKLQQLELWKIPSSLNFNEVKGLRNESRQKLVTIAPSTLAQASRIDGITPSEIALLQVHIERIKRDSSESKNMTEK